MSEPTQKPSVSLDTLEFVGSGLVRPECVLATRRGDLYTADWRGGVARISRDGEQALYLGRLAGGRALRPNGIALRRDGSFLLADLGESLGGIYALDRHGQVRPFLEEVDGIALPPTNFVFEDAVGRTWATVSTRHSPRAAAYRADIADGFIVLADESGARIVAEGLGYTNEALLSSDSKYLYVNETFARKLTRFRVAIDGSLSERELITTFGTGTFPDGLALDVDGGIWVTSIVSNRVIRVAQDGGQQLIIEDADVDHVALCEAAYLSGTMGRAHLDKAAGRILKNISSLAFGGSDLRTAYLGCLLGDSIATFPTWLSGHPPKHWGY